MRKKINGRLLVICAATMIAASIIGCESTNTTNNTGNTGVNTENVAVNTGNNSGTNSDSKADDTDKKDDTSEAIIGTASTSTSESGVTTNGDPIADPVIVEATDSKDTAGNMKQYEKVFVKSSFGCFIDDQAELFEPEEKKVILTFLNGIYPQHFGPTAVVTVEKNSYESTKDFAREYFNDNFETQDGLIFIIDMQYRTLFIYSRGEFATYVTDAKAEEIISQVAGDATNKEYFKCAKGAASLIAREVGIELMEDESFNGVSF